MENVIHISDFENPEHTPQTLEMMKALEGMDIRLDPQSLIAAASQELDVPVQLEPGMMDRFQDLSSEVLANGPTHALGKAGLMSRAVSGITDVSRMAYLRNLHPEIADIRIERPLIVAGMPRSGTTHLLKLLSSDASLHSLYRWQTYQSFPSRAMLEGRAEDNRQATAAEKDAMQGVTLPHFRSLFDVGADDATEEIEVMAKACFGITPTFQGDVPKFDEQFYGTDQTAAYEFLHRYLQTVAWCEQFPKESRWLLKSPQHLGALKAVNGVFPDACFVFTHRDPTSVFTSLITMIGYVLRLTYTTATRRQIIDKTLRMQHGFLRGLVRDIDTVKGPVEHVYFHQFMRNKHETVERIYKASGLTFDSEVEKRISDLSREHSRGRHGRVVYDLEGDFGITRDEIRQEFRYYTDRFPVEIEETHQ